VLGNRKRVWRLLVGLCAALYMSSSWAPPSFNNNRKNLEQLSRDAGAELQLSFRSFHDMFYWLERRDLDKVAQGQRDSLTHLDKALDFFKTLAEKAPKQKLVLRPESESDRAAVERLRERLKSQKLAFPETEADLASLAIKIVTNYRISLVGLKLSGNRLDNDPLLKIIGNKYVVEELGILCTIAWDVSEPK
jgi:hypothetical protein